MKLGLILATCCVTCSRNYLLSGAPATWLHTSLRGFVFLRWEHCLFSFSPYVCVIEILIYIMGVLDDDDVPSVLIFCLRISQSIPGSFSLFLYSSPRGWSVWLLHAHRSYCEPGCWCEWAESLWTAPTPQTRCKSWLPLPPRFSNRILSASTRWKHFPSARMNSSKEHNSILKNSFKI